MRQRNADTVADAVRLLPGATLSRNNRNEEMIYLRGFDPRQVPVFVDGVPLYVPYDGYVDFGRFTTFDSMPKCGRSGTRALSSTPKRRVMLAGSTGTPG